MDVVEAKLRIMELSAELCAAIGPVEGADETAKLSNLRERHGQFYRWFAKNLNDKAWYPDPVLEGVAPTGGGVDMAKILDLIAGAVPQLKAVITGTKAVASVVDNLA